ncbi:MAG TPA: TIM barrel protein [Burkholderiales bacterium]|nr:TIM barrel protein [Burkholderiales bacterium]
MKRAIGLAALSVLECPHDSQVRIAAQAGYTHVGLRLVPVAGQPYQHPLDVPLLEACLRETGVRVLDVEVFRLTPQTKVADWENIFAISQRLGASDILVHGADADESRLIQTFGELCERAGHYRLRANLEPMPWVDVSNISKALRILRGAGKSNSGLLVDAIHFSRARDSLAELKKVPREYLHYAQLCDARPEIPADPQEIIRQARADRLFPGEGGLDLRGLLGALPADLALSLEVPVVEPLEPLERARRARVGTEAILRGSEVS